MMDVSLSDNAFTLRVGIRCLLVAERGFKDADLGDNPAPTNRIAAGPKGP